MNCWISGSFDWASRARAWREAIALGAVCTGRDAPSQNDLIALMLAKQEQGAVLTGDLAQFAEQRCDDRDSGDHLARYSALKKTDRADWTRAIADKMRLGQSPALDD